LEVAGGFLVAGALEMQWMKLVVKNCHA
jgi:hypothetical protein